MQRLFAALLFPIFIGNFADPNLIENRFRLALVCNCSIYSPVTRSVFAPNQRRFAEQIIDMTYGRIVFVPGRHVTLFQKA